MSSDEVMEYQQRMDEREHQRAEWEQEDLLTIDDIFVSVGSVCNCSRCRDLR